MNANPVDPAQLVCVTVTFRPDLARLRAQLEALPRGALKILVDNGSGRAVVAELQRLASSSADTELVPLPTNRGLAAAVNVGTQHHTAIGRRFLLMLDQDSVPQEGSVSRLLEAYLMLSDRGTLVGCVGPALQDPSAGSRHGFHRIKRGFVWGREQPRSTQLVECDGLNGSGTLVELELFGRLGGLDESFFIDHVDTDWSFRVRSAGYKMFGVPDAVFSHAMGERSVRFWLGAWQLWPVRSADRHFYLARNAVRLLRRAYVPWVWKVWAVPKLIATVAVFGIFGPDRVKQIHSIVSGVRAGLESQASSGPLEVPR